MFYLYVLTVF